MSQQYSPKIRPREYQLIIYSSKVGSKPKELKIRLLWIGVASVFFVVLLIFCGIYLTLHSPLKELAPGMVDEELYKRHVLDNRLRIDSIQTLVRTRTDYFSKIKALMAPDHLDTIPMVLSPDKVLGLIDEAAPKVTPSASFQSFGNLIEKTKPFTADETGSEFAEELPEELMGGRQVLAGGIVSGGVLKQFSAKAPIRGLLTRGSEPYLGHFGVDIAAKKGTPVVAIAEGRVIFVDWSRTGGNTIVIQHHFGFISVYKHTSSVIVQLNDWVSMGEVIGLSGNTGEITTGPHLHLELWSDGQYVNPLDYFSDLETK